MTEDFSPVFLFRKQENGVDTFYVYEVTHWDWTTYDSEWMCDPKMGNECLVPDVDLVNQVHEFKSEQEALRKVAQLYALQLAE